MRPITRLMCAATIFALLTCAALPASGDSITAARDVLAKYSNAVVGVSVVVRIQTSYEGKAGEKSEMKNETTGTTVDPSGLTVVSLSQIDPESYWKAMGLDESSGYQYSAETADVKIRLGAGQEIPAKIVLRDRDLDLAFVRPAQKPANPAPFVDFAADAKLQPLDEMIILDRLGKAAGRIPGVRIDRVQAVMEKPRTFYVPSAEALRSSPGAPVFSSDGKVVGLISLRIVPGAAQRQGASGSPDDTFLFVVLPAADVLEVAKQAPEEAVQEKKPAALAPAPAPKPAAAPKPAPKLAPKPAPKPAK